jgi:hypothetical protein
MARILISLGVNPDRAYGAGYRGYLPAAFREIPALAARFSYADDSACRVAGSGVEHEAFE